MNPDLTAPLDELHGLCYQAMFRLRRRFLAARRAAATWQPAPMPEGWR